MSKNDGRIIAAAAAAAAAVGIVFVAIIMITPSLHKLPPSSRPVKPAPLPRKPSLQQPVMNLGSCICVNGVITGPQCSPRVTGIPCHELSNMFKYHSNCVCGPDGVITGAGCPVIGRSCLYNAPAGVI